MRFLLRFQATAEIAGDYDVFNVKHLMSVALAGVHDMRPALVRAFNENPADDRLNLVFGPMPRRRIAALIIGALVAEQLFFVLAPEFEFKTELNWAAIVIVLVYAIALRRYVFVSGHAREDDFPWLAASIIPAAIVLTVLSFVRAAAAGALAPDPDAPWFTSVGKLAFEIANAYGVAAAMTIALAALCFTRKWWLAARDLALNLAVFKILLFLTVLIVIDIGIVGQILAAIIDSTLGLRFPGWLAELSDNFTYAILLATVYTAVIGATWVVCRQNFGALLVTGDVRVVAAVRDMARKPKTVKKPKAPKPKRRRRWFGRRVPAEEAAENSD